MTHHLTVCAVIQFAYNPNAVLLVYCLYVCVCQPCNIRSLTTRLHNCWFPLPNSYQNYSYTYSYT